MPIKKLKYTIIIFFLCCNNKDLLENNILRNKKITNMNEKLIKSNSETEYNISIIKEISSFEDLDIINHDQKYVYQYSPLSETSIIAFKKLCNEMITESKPFLKDILNGKYKNVNTKEINEILRISFKDKNLILPYSISYLISEYIGKSIIFNFKKNEVVYSIPRLARACELHRIANILFLLQNIFENFIDDLYVKKYYWEIKNNLDHYYDVDCEYFASLHYKIFLNKYLRGIFIKSVCASPSLPCFCIGFCCLKSLFYYSCLTIAVGSCYSISCLYCSTKFWKKIRPSLDKYVIINPKKYSLEPQENINQYLSSVLNLCL